MKKKIFTDVATALTLGGWGSWEVKGGGAHASFATQGPGVPDEASYSSSYWWKEKSPGTCLERVEAVGREVGRLAGLHGHSIDPPHRAMSGVVPRETHRDSDGPLPEAILGEARASHG